VGATRQNLSVSICPPTPSALKESFANSTNACAVPCCPGLPPGSSCDDNLNLRVPPTGGPVVLVFEPAVLAAAGSPFASGG
jgi:hypothetical protein